MAQRQTILSKYGVHTKQLQIGMNSAVAAQLWAPQNAYMCPPNGDFSKKISEVLLY